MKDDDVFKVPEPRDGSSRSSRMAHASYLPNRNATILTNLQRGNVRAELAAVPPNERNFYELAAQGELYPHVLLGQMHMLNMQDESGLTGLMWAANYGQLVTVRLLLERGANPRLKGNQGESALLLAAANGHLHVVKMLITAGCDVNDTDNDGNTALIYAAHGDHVHCISELVKANADLTIQNMNQDTAHAIACKRNSLQAKELLEREMLRLVEGHLLQR